MKRFVCMTLTVLMLLSSTALAQSNLTVEGYTQFPLVTEDNSVTLSVAISRNDAYGIDAEDMWFWNWLPLVTGIDFDVTQIVGSALAEKKNLMFASGDLPDILWGLSISTNEMMRYGEGESLLMDLSPYITPEIMPNLCALIEKYPEIKSAITTSSGKVFSMPTYTVREPGDEMRCFIDQNYLDALGVDVPETLDELISFLYACKELDDEMIPLGGSDQAINPLFYIMNAFGYLSTGYNDGSGVAIRNGEAVIPAADETFAEVLALMKQFYDDGIISKDYFTQDNTAVSALMSEGKYAIYPFVPYCVTPDYEDFSHWVSVKPLTSEYNDVQQWAYQPSTTIGGWSVSADSEYGELIARLCDFTFSDVGSAYMWGGPAWDGDELLDMTLGFGHDPETGGFYLPDVDAGVYPDITSYIVATAGYAGTVGYMGPPLQANEGNKDDWKTWQQLRQYLYGIEVPPYKLDETTGDGHFRASMQENITPYLVTSAYPQTVYLTEEDANTINDLESVLQPYMQSECAKFITGRRSLDEYGDYLNELQEMGMGELLALYDSIYQSYMANQ